MCDGLIHCPEGEDEYNCQTNNCTGLYRCVKSIFLICLHIEDVCNGYNDCYSGEDEVLCNIPNQCPEYCLCLMHAITCQHYSLSIMIPFDHVLMFKFYNVTFIKGDAFSIGKHTIVSIWINSKIKRICPITIEMHYKLHFVDFTCNAISLLQNLCMVNTPNLKVIILRHNKIVNVKTNAFSDLHEIALLDLSFNSLTQLSEVFYKEISIFIFNISENYFEIIDEDIIYNLRPKVISSNDVRICCMFQLAFTVCVGNRLLPINCEVILGTSAAKIVTVLCFCLVIFLNILAVLLQLITLRSITFQNKLCTYVTGLTYGIYLLCLFSADQYLGNTYIFYHEKWIEHVCCKTLSFLSLFSIINYIHLLNLYLISQLTAIMFPLYFAKNKEGWTKYLFQSLIVVAILSCFLFAVRIRNGPLPSICTLIENSPSSEKVQVVTLSLIVLQTVSCLSIFVCYLLTFTKLKTSQIMRQSRIRVENQILVQGLLVTTVHLICMLGSNSILILKILNESHPSKLLIWNAILVIPLLFIMDPLMFSICPFVKGKRRMERENINKLVNTINQFSEVYD